ncbi:hypothetical protein DsansV1_C19g0161841 [Dioscorea sansibarensis]
MEDESSYEYNTDDEVSVQSEDEDLQEELFGLVGFISTTSACYPPAWIYNFYISSLPYFL